MCCGYLEKGTHYFYGVAIINSDRVCNLPWFKDIDADWYGDIEDWYKKETGEELSVDYGYYPFDSLPSTKADGQMLIVSSKLNEAENEEDIKKPPISDPAFQKFLEFTQIEEKPRWIIYTIA